MPELKRADVKQPELRRALNLFDLTMIAVGATIGSGIFRTPADIADKVPSAAWILLLWVIGAFFALAGALTNAEMGAMFPRAGGGYVFITEAYGKLAGFLHGWASLVTSASGSIAFLVLLFASYFNGLLDSRIPGFSHAIDLQAHFAGHFPHVGPFLPTANTAVAVAGIVVITVVNIFGVKLGGVFSNIFTVLKLVGIAMLIVVGLGWGPERGHVNFSFAWTAGNQHYLLTALFLGFVGVHFSYGGLENSCNVASETKNPQRTVPLALLIGALTVGAVYCLTNLAYLFLLPVSQIAAATGQAATATQAATPNVATAAIQTVLGPTGAILIALTVCISAFGTTNIYTMTVPRIYYAMAQNKVFFRKLSEVHPRFRTPVNAIVLQALWAIVLLLFWGTLGRIINFVVASGAIMGAVGVSAIFVLRYRQPNTPRPYKTPFYPFTPALYVIISMVLLGYILYDKPLEGWASLGLLAAGVPVYCIWQWSNLSRVAKSHLRCTGLGTLTGLLAGYPLSYIFQPEKFRAANSVHDYVVQISGVFHSPVLANSALEIWIGLTVGLALFGFLGSLIRVAEWEPEGSLRR